MAAVRRLVSTPIFYVNARPHVGHAHSSILTDCLARWRRTLGEEILFSTGTDEHGQKVQAAAQAANITPQELCDQVAAQFQSMQHACGVEPSCFMRTTSDQHTRAVNHFWRVLEDKGLIHLSTYKGWYSVVDEAFYSNHQVEPCSNDSSIMKSKESGSTVKEYSEENYMFRLEDMRDQVKRWIVSGDDVVYPRVYKDQVLAYLSDPLPDLSVSRLRSNLSWGIPVPTNSDHTIYVWLDALVNYLAALGYPDPSWQGVLDTHVIGKDILKFHAVYWPAFLLGAGLDPPRHILVHGHWTVDGAKMSKSVGNVVDPTETIQSCTPDLFRFYLMKEARLGSDADFSQLRMDTVHAELANTFGNLLARSTGKRVNPKGVFPPKASITFTTRESELARAVDATTEEAVHHYNHGEFGLGIEAIMQCLREGNLYFQQHEPWKLAKLKDDAEAAATMQRCLYTTYELLRTVSGLLSPVTPNISATCCSVLGTPLEPGRSFLHTIRFGVTKGGHRLAPQKKKLIERKASSQR